MSTRREFCAMVGMLAAVKLLPYRAALAHVQDGRLAVRRMRDGVWLITEGGGNALLLRTSEGPVLFDAKLAGFAADLHRTTVSTAGKAPGLLINSHHHADHIGGNFAFSGEAEVMAHKNVKPRIESALETRIKPALQERVRTLRESGQPAEASALEGRIAELTVEDFAAGQEVQEKAEFTYGGVRFHLAHYEPAHTDNDMVLRLPEYDILHMGDLLFHELHPFIDRSAKASTHGWQRCLLEAQKLCTDETIVIPGHGEVSDRTALTKQHEYFEKLRAIIVAARASGLTREEIVALQPDVFKDYGFTGIQPRTNGAMYDEL